MPFSDQSKTNNFSSETPGAKRWPLGTLVRVAVSPSLIGGIIWWMGGVGKIGAILSRISFRSAILVLILCTLDRALMTFKWNPASGSARHPCSLRGGNKDLLCFDGLGDVSSGHSRF